MILHLYDGWWPLTEAKPSDDSFVSASSACLAALLVDEPQQLKVAAKCQGLSKTRDLRSRRIRKSVASELAALGRFVDAVSANAFNVTVLVVEICRGSAGSAPQRGKYGGNVLRHR